MKRVMVNANKIKITYAAARLSQFVAHMRCMLPTRFRHMEYILIRFFPQITV